MIDLPVVPVNQPQRKPDWLRVRLPVGKEYAHVRGLVDEHKLHTICESGNCPNMGECWGAGTATFMILGNICTRSCSFCAVATGRPLAVDTDEPNRVANSVKLMQVKHCVITSVDRDDLKDGGSIIWAETINAIRRESPDTTLETLLPDFRGIWDNLDRVLETRPEVVSHNLETVRRLTREVRIQAKYDRSLEALKRTSATGLRTKSGIMLGLGEKEADVLEAMDDLLEAGLQATKSGD
jgi:lipoic acid synthetase